MSRNRPLCFCRDGMPIYYSLTEEKTGVKLHMTFRVPKTSVKNNEPEYGKIIFQAEYRIEENTPECIEKALENNSRDFWTKLFHMTDLKKAEALKACLSREDGLPLQVAWAAGQKELTEHRGWTQSTIQRKEKCMEQLLGCGWGAIPIGQLDARYCGPKFMEEFTSEQHKAAVALLRQLAQHEVSEGRLRGNPWQEKSIFRQAAPKKSAQYIDQHIRATTITSGQTKQIMEILRAQITPGQEGKAPLATLLVLAMGIPLEELCYLTLSAVVCDQTGWPIALHISGSCCVKKKVVSAVPYAETNRKNRILPIPSVVAAILDPLLQAWRQKEPAGKYGMRYLLPHSKNSQRKTDWRDIQRWIDKEFAELLEDTRYRDGTGQPLRRTAADKPYQKILKTAQLSLRYAGYEDDELDYQFGMTPKTVAGKCYLDPTNEGVRNRMAALSNRRLTVGAGEVTPPPTVLENPAAGTVLSLNAGMQATQAIITLTFPPIPEDRIPERGYEIELTAQRGLSLGAVFIKKTE